ncbi:ABC transporter substrate-binding protein [Lederbergia citrea]|uniref:Sugar ABC transporter substrate-binding protein n=1 Tax=Lederbergia citrea TaxID=2833581 RepID=A0A942ULX1_9BACI|nr:sugar ABC transporter substrate-binding protein [Lederbergia citrea]MBS4223780.1 sugar ABC transporter substrate-binding protein [Lederbergia citrea]
MKNKLFLILAAFCLIFMTACSSGSKESGGNKSSGGSSSDDQVVIKIWDYLSPDSSSGKEQEALIEKYQEENPNIKFERTYIPFADLKTKLLQGVAGGNLPDIVVIDNPDHQSFIEAGVFADISQEIQDWGQIDKYFEGPVASAMMDGKYYGIPNNSNALAIYYNKDMFEEAGITELPETWDELRETAKKLTKDDVKGFAMAGIKDESGTFQFLPYLWQSGSDLDSFDSQEAKKAMSFIKSLVDDGSLSQNMINWGQSDVLVQFQTKKAAMMENGPWQIPTLKEETKDFDWGVFLMPIDKQPASVLGGENWAITADSENKKEAWDFIKWTQEPEILGPMHELGGRLPSRSDLAEDEQYVWAKDEHVKVFMQQLESAKPRAYGSKYPEISTYVQEAIQRAITGEDVGKVMEDTAKKIEPLLP